MKPIQSLYLPKTGDDMKKIFFFLCATALLSFFLFGECYADSYAYVSNNADDTVSIISVTDNTLIATVDVGSGPWGIATDPNGDYVYTTNNFGSNVSVISTYYNAVTATINVGGGPMGISVNPNGDYVYVANNSDATVSVIDTSNNTVTAYINVGNSPVAFGEYVVGTPPQAPGNLAATTASESEIDLSWTDNSYDEAGFKVERKLYGGSFSQIAVLEADVTFYRDAGLRSYRTYYYRVRAYNDGGNSDYSNEASATTDEEESNCFISSLR